MLLMAPVVQLLDYKQGLWEVFGVRVLVLTFLIELKMKKKMAVMVKLSEAGKSNLSFKFFIFFQAQALLDVILSIPFLILVQDPREDLRWTQWIALGLWVISMYWRGGGRSATSAVQIRTSPQGSNLSTRTMALF